MRLNHFINKKIKLRYKCKVSENILHGIITAVGKEHILFLDFDKSERPVKKKNILSVDLIQK